MRQVLKWMMTAVLCCAAAAAAREEPQESQLEVAQEAYEEAKKLYAAGKYTEALGPARRALALTEGMLGRAHLDVAPCLELLGVLHQLQGDTAGAEPLLRRGLEIREAALGESHPDVASSLIHLASLYTAQGAYERAAPLYERALTLREAALGEAHPQVAIVLNNLAQLYSEQGLYEQAEPLYTRALAIQQGALGEAYPNTASLLNNLASLQLSLGRYERAGLMAERALAIQEAALGKRHPQLVPSLNNLALVLARQGGFEKAELLYRRALMIVEATQGRNHPDVADLLNNMARLRLARGQLGAALPLLKRAFAISELRLRREALDFSEARLTSFLAHLRTQEDMLYELLRAEPQNAEVRHLALTAALLRKGRSVEEMADTSRIVYQRVSEKDREAFARLRGLRSQLASLSLQGPGNMSPFDYRQRLKELAEQGDVLEAGLARRSAPMRALMARPLPEDMVDHVTATLPMDGALVEFIAYMDRGLLRKPGAPEPRDAQLRYQALVLFSNRRILALDLGAAAPIDSAAAAMRSALASRDAQFLASAQALYALAFHRLRVALGRTRSVFLSPDGQLGLIPFAALHDGHQFLVDSYDFTYLTSGKDLLPRSNERAPSQSVVVLADPDFSLPLPPSPDKPPGPVARSFFVERFFSTHRADLAERPWPPLPGTRREAEAIQRLLPGAQLFLGPEATKERLLYLSAPGVLHLATHGFFLEDTGARGGARAVGHFGALGTDARAVAPADPLLRAGLILAGASAPAPGASEAARRPMDNSLVTALELASLNLWGTQLVVLSACDTGRGDVKLGQGVYGLRRAFIAAGAETVVMSLWKVNDETTQELMESYYHHLLARQGRATALRQAMLALRLSRPHPHYWAPFIAMGQNTPLRVRE